MRMKWSSRNWLLNRCDFFKLLVKPNHPGNLKDNSKWPLKMIGCLWWWWCMCFQHRNCLLPRLLPFKGWTAVNWRSHFVGIWKNKMLGKLFFYTENLCRGNEGWPCLGSVINGKFTHGWVKNFQVVKRIARLEGVLVYLFGFAFCFLAPGFAGAEGFFYYYNFGGFLLVFFF